MVGKSFDEKPKGSPLFLDVVSTEGPFMALPNIIYQTKYEWLYVELKEKLGKSFDEKPKRLACVSGCCIYITIREPLMVRPEENYF